MSPAGRPRVLVVVPHPRYTGTLAIDGFGIVPRSLVTWDLRRKCGAGGLASLLARRVVQAIDRLEPTHIVLGAAVNDRPAVRRLRVQLARELGRRGIQPRTDPGTATREVLFAGCESFAEVRRRLLAWFALPELEPRNQTDSAGDWYWRNVWHAAAIAVAVLVEHDPLSAAALARPEAHAKRAFAALLRDRLRELEHPSPPSP